VDWPAGHGAVCDGAGKPHAPTMLPSYRPSGGYYRRAIRAAHTRASLVDLALSLVRETEYLRTWARANGLRPPHFEVTAAEASARGGKIIAIPMAVTRSRVLASGPDIVPEARESQ
jgi:hypothetical protein